MSNTAPEPMPLFTDDALAQGFHRAVQVAPFSNATTSKAAALSIAADLPTMEETVREAIKGAGERGLTCAELEVLKGLSHQTASARIRGLALKGRILDSGDKRPTPSGRAAIVWKAYQ